MSQLQCEEFPLGDLHPWARNARTHSRKQIRQIAESIRAFGFTNPVLIDDENRILAGHGRVAAAKEIGMSRVPCIRLSQMSAAQKRAYVIADNKLALNAGWDEEILAGELQELIVLDEDFDVSVTGFSIPEIDVLIEGLAPQEEGDPSEDQMPPIDEKATVTRFGDLWQLGPHRLVCGDALDAAAYERLLEGAKAGMIFTDPPYNVRIKGNVGGLGSVKHRDFVMASGEMSRWEFTGFLETAFKHMAAHSLDGSIHFVCMDWRHIAEIMEAGSKAYTELKNMCVWVKDNGGMGTFYRSRHELVFAFKSGTASHVNNFELGQNGRYRTNVWEYKGVNTLKAGRIDELSLHPTVKPVAMIADAIKDVSKRNEIILDAFGGSGSTLIAAHKTGRRARLIELDPLYADRTIRRWQAYAHEDAIHVDSGRCFDELAVERNRMCETVG